MSDPTAQPFVVKLDTAPLERLDARHKIGVAVEIIAGSIAPSNFDFTQRVKIENGLNLLVDLILIEAEARAVARLGGAQ